MTRIIEVVYCAIHIEAFFEMSVKNCAFPNCGNKSGYHDKFFFSSPECKKMRKRWLVQCELNLSANTRFSLCEDHFDLPNDLENYAKFVHARHIYSKHKLKRSTLPKKVVSVVCENNDKGRTASINRARKSRVKEILENAQPIENLHRNLVPVTTEYEDSSSVCVGILNTEKATQCNLLTAPTQCKQKVGKRSKHVQTSNIKRDVALSPIFFENTASTWNVYVDESSSSSFLSPPSPSSLSSSSSVCSANMLLEDKENDTSVISSDDEQNVADADMEARKHIALFLCRSKPKLYLGIPQASLHICDILADHLKCSVVEIYTVLQKIKMDYSFEEIGDHFGITKFHMSKRFSKFTPLMAACLKNFIIWPSREEIKRNLPIAFRANYKNIQIIIDCFEVEIQKPKNPVFQTLTWSEYKKANTIKYLIGCTPNGIISYISEGFGGRSSDIEIVENSDFLEKLPPNAEVMADRGFKSIDSILAPYNCKLIRPPSVHKDEKLSKAEVIRSKQIASLRIHIERVIRRIRIFRFLEPHSTVPTQLIRYLDHCVIIAAALSNIQPPLIKNDE